MLTLKYAVSITHLFPEFSLDVQPRGRYHSHSPHGPIKSKSPRQRPSAKLFQGRPFRLSNFIEAISTFPILPRPDPLVTFPRGSPRHIRRDREKETGKKGGERERTAKSRPHARTRRGYRFHVFPFGNCLVFFYTPRLCVCVCACVSGHGGKIDTISRYLEPSRSGWSPKSDHALCESALIRAPSTRHGAACFFLLLLPPPLLLFSFLSGLRVSR